MRIYFVFMLFLYRKMLSSCCLYRQQWYCLACIVGGIFFELHICFCHFISIRCHYVMPLTACFCATGSWSKSQLVEFQNARHRTYRAGQSFNTLFKLCLSTSMFKYASYKKKVRTLVTVVILLYISIDTGHDGLLCTYINNYTFAVLL